MNDMAGSSSSRVAITPLNFLIPQELDDIKQRALKQNLQKYEQLFGADEDAFIQPTTTRKELFSYYLYYDVSAIDAMNETVLMNTGRQRCRPRLLFASPLPIRPFRRRLGPCHFAHQARELWERRVRSSLGLGYEVRSQCGSHRQRDLFCRHDCAVRGSRIRGRLWYFWPLAPPFLYDCLLDLSIRYDGY